MAKKNIFTDAFGNLYFLKRLIIFVLGIVSYRRFNGFNKLKITGSENLVDLPDSNVLLFEIGGEKGIDWACVRPSGTEPKLKIYFGVYGADKTAALERLAALKTEVSALIEKKL